LEYTEESGLNNVFVQTVDFNSLPKTAQ